MHILSPVLTTAQKGDNDHKNDFIINCDQSNVAELGYELPTSAVLFLFNCDRVLNSLLLLNGRLLKT